MSQSFVQIYVHIVFHTKDNVGFIKEDIENELYSYPGGILKNYKSIPLQIGGTSDHIHILCTLPKTMALADLAEEIKKSSSKWIKTKGIHYSNFYWQKGYGGFSISNSGVGAAFKRMSQIVILYSLQADNIDSFSAEWANLST